jgi:hypothetical protein
MFALFPRFLLVGGGQKPALHAAYFHLAFSLRPRCFRFIGRGGFWIRLARRRAHPCDEQAVAIACSFSLFFQKKLPDSILWVGPAMETRPEQDRR